MSFSLYDASIPLYLQMMRNLDAILDKAAADAATKGVEISTLLEAKLAPDMHPLARQIQMVSDGAKGGAARLAGIEAPSMADTETTLPELKERLAKTIAFVEGVKREQVDGREGATIELKFPGRTMTFTGASFLTTFSLPNFMFHVVTAYAILRAQGAPLGKMDFLAAAQMA
ncbi:DUF1993 family protein [Phenylobacterium aquaticum]|uniref:DUF1993 domain-containing protein n=1 Tax=Phenylobacterium aquaticum TaxID=1763816 RepID=UPI0026F17144|nr:DUF1993 domain-containing protein [Phenylobacterium aquaticum]